MGLLAAAALRRSDAAQQIYRIVGPDGKVTFSDQPPVEASAKAARTRRGQRLRRCRRHRRACPSSCARSASATRSRSTPATTAAPATPAAPCCASRGIPFAEQTVTTNEDIEACKRLSGARLAAAADHRRAAAQGLLGRRVVAVPGRGRLPEELAAAGRLPQPPAARRWWPRSSRASAGRAPRPAPPQQPRTRRRRRSGAAGSNPAGIRSDV